MKYFPYPASEIMFKFLNSFRLFVIIISTLALSSCNKNYRLKLMVPNEDVQAMKEIASEISTHSRFEILVESQDSLTEVKAIDQLMKAQFDITTVDNTLDYKKSKKDIRTVIPFFHEVLVVLSKDKLKQIEIDSLIRNGNYLILSKEEDELDFYRRMIPNFTGDSTINYQLENHFNLEEDLENNKLILFFSAQENYELGKLLFNEKAFLYSLDHKETIGKGSFIEGFCESYKKTTPYILSRFAFGITLDEPIFTLAVHELLVASTDLPKKVVYDLIETIHHHHIIPIFESSNSYTFAVNHQDINLSFPFHSGTINYLNRDQPTFVERYAEVMGFILSAFILLIGLIASLRATVNQRKKDRMDEYYHELLVIKENIQTISDADLRKKLTDMQKVVFDLLIREKLSANNEFVIFMMLWDELHQELINPDEIKVQ